MVFFLTVGQNMQCAKAASSSRHLSTQAGRRARLRDILNLCTYHLTETTQMSMYTNEQMMH